MICSTIKHHHQDINILSWCIIHQHPKDDDKTWGAPFFFRRPSPLRCMTHRHGAVPFGSRLCRLSTSGQRWAWKKGIKQYKKKQFCAKKLGTWFLQVYRMAPTSLTHMNCDHLYTWMASLGGVHGDTFRFWISRFVDLPLKQLRKHPGFCRKICSSRGRQCGICVRNMRHGINPSICDPFGWAVPGPRLHQDLRINSKVETIST